MRPEGTETFFNGMNKIQASGYYTNIDIPEHNGLYKVE